jgi:Flp pilus assembly protein TadG
VGIFDFGSAFDTKQKLSNAAQEGARTGSLLPLNDSSSSAPESVRAIRDVVARYLQGAGLNDCGLQGAPMPTGVNMTWEYDVSGGGCLGTLKLKIERPYPVAATVGGFATKLLNTRVTLTYPYRWKFNSVIQLLVPGGGTGVTEIVAASTMLNQS